MAVPMQALTAMTPDDVAHLAMNAERDRAAQAAPLPLRQVASHWWLRIPTDRDLAGGFHELGHIVLDAVIVALMRDPDMRRRRQTGRLIERSCGGIHRAAILQPPEQLRAAS